MFIINQLENHTNMFWKFLNLNLLKNTNIRKSILMNFASLWVWLEEDLLEFPRVKPTNAKGSLQMKTPDKVWYFTKGGVPPLPPYWSLVHFRFFHGIFFFKIWNIFSFDICSEYNSLVHGSSQVCCSWTAVWLISTDIEMWSWSY